MQRSTLIALNVAAAGLLVGWSPTIAELRFAPTVGTSASKTYTSELDFELDDASVMVDGEDVLGAMGLPEFRLEVSSSYTVTDQYLAVSGGRPTKLERLFDSLGIQTEVSISMMGESQDESQDTGSKLDGKRVVFTWNEEDEDYDVAWAADESGPDDALDGLHEDMDLRALLPGRSVEPGDSWELSMEALEVLWMPGGDLAWEADVDDAEFQAFVADALESFIEDLHERLTGTRTATFSGTREVDGRELGIIELALDLELDFDAADMIRELLSKAEGLPEELAVEFSRASINYATRLDGELLWDMAAGLAESLSLSGDYDITVEIGASVEFMGERTDIEATMLGSGTMTSGAKVERE